MPKKWPSWWEPWMGVVDELRTRSWLDAVYEAQGQRREQSRVRGRQQTPAEVALRMLILKNVCNWSYETLEREVRANVVYRSFCRIGMQKVPDAKTLVRLGQVIGAKTIAELHDRIVAIAQQRRVIQGRKMRVDTSVVETNIHYPTDSGLLNDGARVLTRTMKKIAGKARGLKRKVRDRTRSVSKRVMAVAQGDHPQRQGRSRTNLAMWSSSRKRRTRSSMKCLKSVPAISVCYCQRSKPTSANWIEFQDGLRPTLGSILR